MNEFKKNSLDLLFNKFVFEKEHARQVCKLSLLIFDKSYDMIHNFGKKERELLLYGSLLHDIGYFISADGHNKHSYKIITQEGIEGLDPNALEIVGNIARYHRGKKPSKKHKSYSKLTSEEDRQLVKKLSSIVRLADGLDRSHLSVVNDLDLTCDSFSNILFIVATLAIPDCSSEVWALEKKKKLFEKEFNIQVKLKVN